MSLKKNLQNYFKNIGYFLFKILYGKIKYLINDDYKQDVIITKVKKQDKFLYNVFKIKNGRLYTDRVNDTAIIKNNQIIGGPSFQFRTIDNNIINANVKDNLVLKNGTPRFKKKLDGKVLSLLTGGGGNENYWHWMFDVLPRLSLCESVIKLDLINFFLLPDNKKRFQIETLDMLGIPKKKQITSIRFRHISSQELYVTSHPVVLSNNATKDIKNIPDWILSWLKQKFIKNNPKSEKNYSKKIYLDRSDSTSNVKNLRSIINEHEVKNYLAKKGFQSIKLTDLHFEDQVHTFYNADTIIGLHGAGFANVTFCKPNTKIVEIKANPLDDVIKSLAIKNNLNHCSISCKIDEIDKNDQFGHINVSLQDLDGVL